MHNKLGKNRYFRFPHFLENYRFLKVENIFFEDSSPKGFFWQIIRIFDVFSLASDSRYLQSWAHKNTKLLDECFTKYSTKPTAFQFKIYLFSFYEWHCMMTGLKQTTIKFKPRIKLNHNMYSNDYWNSLQPWPGHTFLFLSFQGADYFTFEGLWVISEKQYPAHWSKGKKILQGNTWRK